MMEHDDDDARGTRADKGGDKLDALAGILLDLPYREMKTFVNDLHEQLGLDDGEQTTLADSLITWAARRRLESDRPGLKLRSR